MSETKQHAVVLVSGGLDSATTLAMARAAGFACHAMSFDYGQRQRVELESARTVAKALGVVEHRFVTIDLRAFGGSALTADIEVPKDRPSDEMEKGIPITYVPARNTIFLSYALGYAEANDISEIFIGVNAVDYSGYPDCRGDYIKAYEKMANLATKMGIEGRRITIHTPLIDLTKAQIIRKGIELDVDYGLTLSCYDPECGTEDEGVTPCGHCDSCLLRAAGFAEAGMADPANGT